MLKDIYIFGYFYLGSLNVPFTHPGNFRKESSLIIYFRFEKTEDKNKSLFV